MPCTQNARCNFNVDQTAGLPFGIEAQRRPEGWWAGARHEVALREQFPSIPFRFVTVCRVPSQPHETFSKKSFKQIRLPPKRVM
jgi:hypothetical protein